MSEPIWKLMPILPMQTTQSVWREWPNGHQESCLVTAPEYLKWLAEGNEPLPADSVIPPKVTEVTMRQARLALLGAGLLDDVDAALNAIPNEVQRKAALIEWEFSNTVQRDMSLVQQLAPALGLSEQQLDNLFAQAAQL
jgi:hypothetical protein